DALAVGRPYNIAFVSGERADLPRCSARNGHDVEIHVVAVHVVALAIVRQPRERIALELDHGIRPEPGVRDECDPLAIRRNGDAAMRVPRVRDASLGGAVERLHPDLRRIPTSRVARTGKETLVVGLVAHVVDVAAVEA